jgi:beta-alanine--pyruvate transaminase
MPFTDNRSFKRSPRMLSAASGIHYTDDRGRRIIDAVSGLWCANAGHGRPEIVEAISEQASRLDYAPCFQFGHPAAFEFASQLIGHMPHGFGHILFANSGSEAVDTALKVALACHRALGQGGRTRLIGRERAYHGVGFGGMSVGGIGMNRAAFGPMLPGVDHIRHTHDPAAAFTRGQPEEGADLADDVERLVQLHGAETIAAVIVEPVAGSTGVLVPPKGYLERLRKVTRRHGIFLIFDEVITGFGRIGGMTSADVLGVAPDILVLAKGLTNGTIPMGAVAVRDGLHDAIVHSAKPGIELFHGYTCAGHPIAAAAGMATLRIFEKEALCLRARELAPFWEQAVHALRGAPFVIDIRNFGMAAAIELTPRGAVPGARGMDALTRCFERGVLVRVTGDTIALAPPLVIERHEIEALVGMVGQVLRGLD